MSLRRIDDMPPGTIGFEAIGEVEDDDWEKQVEPVLRSEMAEGQKIRLLYLLGPEAREVEGDAMTADTGFRARFVSRRAEHRGRACISELAHVSASLPDRECRRVRLRRAREVDGGLRQVELSFG